MGVLTYLMLKAGLLVFTGQGTAQAPELLWVIAFVGSFSDTLSINLLQRLLGRFEPINMGQQVQQNSSKGVIPGTSDKGDA